MEHKIQEHAKFCGPPNAGIWEGVLWNLLSGYLIAKLRAEMDVDVPVWWVGSISDPEWLMCI
jgi:hypothetical protein